MAKIEKFEDIKAWQLAKDVTKLIYQATNKLPFSNDFSLKDQIRRASVSSMANIAEGFERKSNKEFKQFLFIARGSAGEVRSHLYLAYELDYLSKDTFINLLAKIQEVSKSIWGFISYLQETNL